MIFFKIILGKLKMFQKLPFEILEVIGWYLRGQDLYSFSKIDERVAEIIKKTNFWIVIMPKQIDWSSPNAPKKYIPYDKTDFTILYRDQKFCRDDGISFTKQKNSLVSKSDSSVILYRDQMAVDPKDIISYDEIKNILCYWVKTVKKSYDKCAPQRIPRKSRFKFRPDSEKPWRSSENIQLGGHRYETDFSFNFQTDHAFLDYSENEDQ